MLYESLEKRVLLSANLDSSGALRVLGTSGADVVGLRVVETTLRVDINGTLSKFLASSVTSISIDLLEGDDLLALGPGVIGVYALGGLGNDQMTGGPGKDTLTGGGGRDTLNGSTGDDRLDGGPTADYLIGFDGSDRLYGSDANDILDGGAGVDRLYGNDGNDSLLGGSSNDKLYGFAGDDTLIGGNQNDLLFGGDADDSLLGGLGIDTLFGQLGNDDLNGQQGDDVLFGEAGQDFIDGADGNDSINGGDDNDTLFGFDGNDSLSGETGDDKLRGERGNDVLDGGGAADSLSGGDDDDAVVGSDGNDGLFGGAGDDSLVGSSGADRFLHRSGDDDSLSDFDNDVDAEIVFSVVDRSWTDSEINQVDDGLGMLVARTNNTRMLKQSNGGGLTIRRRRDLGETTLAINSGRGRITMADLAFDEDNNPAGTIIHEIGHNFDEPAENPTADDFRDISGWHQDLFGDWDYHNNAGFAYDYGKTNPYEDFATALETYFTKDTPARFWQEKWNYMDRFLTTMSK